MEYVELQACSNFSFLEGASHPEELIQQAAALGYSALALTDHNSLAGIVRAHKASRAVNLKFIVGTKLDLKILGPLDSNEISVLCYPKDVDAYAHLCELLTIGKRRVEKGACLLTLGDFLPRATQFVLILLPPKPSVLHKFNDQSLHFVAAAQQIKDTLTDKDQLSIAISKNYLNSNHKYLEATIDASKFLAINLVATNDVCYHHPQRKPLQDVLTCIKYKHTVYSAGYLLGENSERYLKPVKEMGRLFKDLPQAITRTVEISQQLNFSLAELRYDYPDQVCPAGQSPLDYLTKLVWAGARLRYPHGIPDKVANLINQELALIHELSYEKYFLTCQAIVTFARSKGILCQGRGAAANSAVCFCLGITSVDPDKIDLLFARFVSKERNEPPDIDIDFEHERREEVIQYIYNRFGREYAGLTAEVVSYRHRSATRDVAKALGLSVEAANKMAKALHHWTGSKLTAQDLIGLGLDPTDERIKHTLTLTQQLLSFPRHLSQHVGGFIISEKPLSHLVPILNATMADRTIIEWDKDDIEELGMLKIDVLGLGMLTCIRKALDLINLRRIRTGQDPIDLHTIPAEDPAVYEMLARSDTIGVFQIESRAQMSMLPRLKPKCFYDLVIEVALVRPGPIQGNMVHPYLKRRAGLEKPYYPDSRVEHILGKTLGVPIFQEQAMKLAIALAGFSPGEAEQLRRSMSAWKKDKGAIAKFRDRILAGMLANGYSSQFADTCVDQLKGFSEYGFPESHAASFALLVYASAWIKRHYPAEFAVALLNSQPMGFYGPAQIVADVKAHGIEVRPIDINKSEWHSIIEINDDLSRSIRLGLRLVKGLEQSQALIISSAVKSYGQFNTITELWTLANLKTQALRRVTLQRLARADAFRSFALTPRDALWQIKALIEQPLTIDRKINCPASSVLLPAMDAQTSIFQDYNTIQLSLKGHPLELIRAELNSRQVRTAVGLKNLSKLTQYSWVSTAGIAIFKQRPHTAKGTVFVTLEDETGISNLIIKPEIFDKYSKIILSGSIILASGLLERVGEVIYINAQIIESANFFKQDYLDHVTRQVRNEN